MSNRHSLHYIFALVVFLFSYIGYRVYKDSVDLKVMKTEISQRSLDKNGRSPGTGPPPRNQRKETPSKGTATIGDIVVKEQLISKKPMKVRYGPPLGDVGEVNVNNIVTVPGKTWYADELVTQLVETPDGKIHRFLLPPDEEYQIKPGDFIPQDWRGPAMMMVEIDGVMYDVPEGESMNSYIDKIHLSSMYDVPLEEVGSLIEEHVIPSSPIDAQYDPLFAPSGESQMMGDSAAEVSGFEDSPARSDGMVPVRQSLTGRQRLTTPVSPITPEPSPKTESAHEHHSDVHGHKNSNAENIETKTIEGLSVDRFDKAQQLIDEYGTEEGLRRLREMDPDAAEQFEREQREPHIRSEPDDEPLTR